MSTEETSKLLPYVSVIIPVYDDQGELAQCLAALEMQDYPARRFEVIVVDNGRNQDLSELRLDGPALHIVEETKPGSYAARNSGVLCAKGDVLAFTDADCRPMPEWLSRGVAALQRTPNIGLVGGAVEFAYADPGKPTTVELYDSVVHLNQAHYIAKDHFSVSANLFTTPEVIEAVGSFDDRLLSSGDREWGNRVFAAGYSLAYAADAVIMHPARRSLATTLAKARRVSGGNVARLQQLGALNDVGSIFRYIVAGLAPPITLLRIALQRMPRISKWRFIRLLAVMTLVKYARTVEGVRVLIGGTTRR